MPTQLEDDKKAAQARYETLLAALNAMHAAHAPMLFEMIPNQDVFNQMVEKDSVVNPLPIQFKSKTTGATFTVENKFFPHSWVITYPKEATKEEKSCMTEVILEAIAHPQDAHQDYEPKLLAYFPEDTPEEEIFEFIDMLVK